MATASPPGKKTRRVRVPKTQLYKRILRSETVEAERRARARHEKPLRPNLVRGAPVFYQPTPSASQQDRQPDNPATSDEGSEEEETETQAAVSVNN